MRRSIPLPRPAIPVNPLRRGRAASPIRSAPVQLYSNRLSSLPLTGAQAILTINAGGEAMASVAPSGLGTIWYPASAVIGTSVAPFDASTVSIYIGPVVEPSTLQGQITFGGSGVIALAIPSMSPGLSIIAVWTGATPGSVVSMNVTGSMSLLTRAS